MTNVDVDAVLSRLKDFQRATVDYVFRRLYVDPDCTRRFLIADEVGLGKTLVARGLIAKTIEHIRQLDNRRIDIVYICSNLDIARQNINRLNVTEDTEVSLASRITLLPTTIRGIKQRDLNFISFTPGTSLDPRSSMGTVEERALIFRLLNRAWALPSRTAALNVLQGFASPESFRWHVRWSEDCVEIDDDLADAFADQLATHDARASTPEERLHDEFIALSKAFPRARRNYSRIPWDLSDRRRRHIQALRAQLATACIKALEPDLVILDEFQRFKSILHGDDIAATLARELFDYGDARILLLSATPYKMYTLHGDSEEDHYQDFRATLDFLANDPAVSEQVAVDLRRYRHALFTEPIDSPVLRDSIRQIEDLLRRYMVRTERLAITTDRDGMLREVPGDHVELRDRDLLDFVAVQRLARILRQPNVLEYWKSAPYLLNVMDDYELKRSLRRAIGSGTAGEAARALEQLAPALLDPAAIRRFDELDPGNPRMRDLIASMVDSGAWRLLWVPPALPYYRLDSPYNELDRFTKRLVFSAWSMVPRAISALLSYAAEREIALAGDPRPENTTEWRSARGGLLQFTRSEGRLTGMPVLGLLYPSAALARCCDPRELARGLASNGALPDATVVLKQAQLIIEEKLDHLPGGDITSGPEDETWYWAAGPLLDLREDPDRAREWIEEASDELTWTGDEPEDEDDADSRLSEHVDQLFDLMEGRIPVGRRPSDLSLVLAEIAIGGPGVTAARALARVTGGPSTVGELPVLRAAAQIAWGFRSLFNLPEAALVLREKTGDVRYWELVARHGVTGGLQAVLDEYLHVLVESIGLEAGDPRLPTQLAEAVVAALGIRAAQARLDAVSIEPAGPTVGLSPLNMRTRFGARFADDTSDDERRVNRAAQVRIAFNSPFWPFVLSTTSIGQEGLDFHLYCHAIVHWNLPNNPVDLEQREGRIHRYKNHAVRRNVAQRFGLDAARSSADDAWEEAFAAAVRARPNGTSDIVPFWVYPIDGGAVIERHVPSVPLSRERQRLEDLRRSLVVYRMAFGQSRQEDLVQFLAERSEDADGQELDALRVDLSPPQLAEGDA